MPQKRNPDYAELVRARAGTVHGCLLSVLAICKALPYSYNRDLQEVTPHLLPAAPGHEPRCALSVEVRIAGRAILFIGTHLDHTRGDADRVQQAHTITRLFADSGVPMILAGDLNDVPGGPSNLVFMGMWHDAAAANPSPTFPSGGPERRIDYVFYHPAEAWQAVRSEVIAEPLASDHCPLLSVLRLRDEGAGHE